MSSLAEEPKMELGLTKTESASVYFTGIYKAYLSTQYVFASDINPTISKTTGS